jgi:hypothetical protein
LSVRLERERREGARQKKTHERYDAQSSGAGHRCVFLFAKRAVVIFPVDLLRISQNVPRMCLTETTRPFKPSLSP